MEVINYKCFNFTNDNANRIDVITHTQMGVPVATFDYDYNNRDQLTTLTDNNGLDVSYDYDEAGNQTQKDENGQITSFDYSPRQRIKTINQNGVAFNYTYDHLGNRTSKESQGQKTLFNYDGTSLLYETNTIGNVLAKYHYGSSRILAETRSGANQYMFYDALSAPIVITNQDGSIQNRVDYDAWGNQIDQTATDDHPFGFTGYQQDKETDLYYAKARYYDAHTGRFLREDPFEGNANTPPTLHRYLYAYANPTVYIDPDGEAAYAFDATKQDRNTGVETNVVRLLDLYRTPNQFYVPGVGTNENIIGLETAGVLFGAGGQARLEYMYQKLVNTYNGIGPNGELIEPDKIIDLIGGSRGAALARAFGNMIDERGIPDYSSARTVTKYYRGYPVKSIVYDKYFKPEIRSMILFDTVASFGFPNQDEGNKNLSIPNNVEAVRHAVARDENSTIFPLTSVIDPGTPKDPRIIEKVFEGVHSDIICCYLDDDSLSHDPLFWSWNELKKLNVPIDSIPPKYLPIAPSEAKPNKLKYVNYFKRWVAFPQQGSRTNHKSKTNTSSRTIYYLRNGSDDSEKDFNPVIYPEHERLLREFYGKDYQFVHEEDKKP